MIATECVYLARELDAFAGPEAEPLDLTPEQWEQLRTLLQAACDLVAAGYAPPKKRDGDER